MPILYSRGVIVTDENPNDITEIRTTSDAPISYNSANETYYKFDSTLAVGSRWVAQAGFFTLPTLTAGSVLFSNGTTIAQDNTNFFWHDSNNALQITGYGYFYNTDLLNPALYTHHSMDGVQSYIAFNAASNKIFGVGTGGLGNGIISVYDSTGSETISLNSASDSYFNTTGKFGIGTVSPSEQLSVQYNNNSYERGLSINNTNVGTTSLSGLQLKHNSTSVANFDYYPSNYANASLHNFTSLNTLGATGGLILNTNAAGANNAASGDIKIFTGGNTTPAIFVKGSDGSGNVGISNASPSVALDVTGTVKISSLAAGGASKVVFANSSGQLSATAIAIGSVTSVDMTVPTGLSVTGNPITTSGTLAVTYTAGYSLPTTTSQTNWDGAFEHRIQAGNFASRPAASGYGKNYYAIDQGVEYWDNGSTWAAKVGALTGDVTSSVNSLVTTLATVNSNVGTFGSTTQSPVITVDGKGRITAISNATIAGGSGTVTSVSVTTANGVSGSVATATTTPAITLTLGAITPTTVNGLTIATTTGTLNIGSLKQVTFNNTLAFSGTDSTTMTFPTTNATIARTDAAQTFTGIQTMTSPALTTPTITGTPTGTGVATAATASTLVLRDANVNIKSNNNVDNFTTTATAAGTTTLTVSSSKIQEFTGTTTQTITLPVASTLTTGHAFKVINNSTDNVTVNSSGSNLVYLMGPNSCALVTCILASGTSAASWTTEPILNPIFGIPFMIGDGVNVLTVGTKVGMYIPFGFTILEWTLGSVTNTSGSVQLDIWVDTHTNFPPTVADSITASDKPLITSSTRNMGSSLTGWTTTFAPDRWVFINVDSVTSITQLSGTLKCRKL